MYPLHDNDLDRLSREAAEHFEVEPGASGWAHLEKRLDEELPQKKKRRRFLFWLFFITATTGGALTGILTYKPASPLGKNAAGVVTPAQKPAAPQQQATATTATNETVQPVPATGSTPATTPAQAPANSVNPNPVSGNLPKTIGNNEHESRAVTTSPAAPKPSTTGANQGADATTSATLPGANTTQSITKAGNHKRLKPVSKTVADRSPLSLNYATIAPTGEGLNSLHSVKTTGRKTGKKKAITTDQHTQPVSAETANTTTPDRGITANDQQPTTEQVVVNNDPVTAQAAATPTDSTKNNTVVPPAADSAKTLVKENNKKEDPKKDKNVKGFELGLVAGPDLSTVKFGPLYKTGYIFGLQIGYRFSNRWSVNTGVLYTKKFYQAKGKDFDYKAQWPIDKAEGHCSMWEIPVNVRYDVSFNTKRRWFVSTGLSTYLMDKEKYDLYYTWNGATYPMELNSDSNTNYLFSILNLSVGMERSLGKHFSIQAEPYLKVPLQGLGKGSIRMDSYGIFFTLKYKPGFRTKK